MSTISTHVLDTVLGKPAAGIVVRLDGMWGGAWSEKNGVRDQDIPGEWVEISRSVTDLDGRCRDLPSISADEDYRLTFMTGAYLAGHGRTTIYPEISIVFRCSGDEHYHLPLLLSDNSYTTYRGS